MSLAKACPLAIQNNQFLRFFWNSAWVSIIVVTITMLISVPAAFALARMKFWGSATLATGVFLTYLIPDSLLFIPLFKMFAVFGDWTGIQLVNRWYVLLFIYPTLTVPFCTWIMIGYFETTPLELEEAALIDGATRWEIVEKVILPSAKPALLDTLRVNMGCAWTYLVVAELVAATPAPRDAHAALHGGRTDPAGIRVISEVKRSSTMPSASIRKVVRLAMPVVSSNTPKARAVSPWGQKSERRSNSRDSSRLKALRTYWESVETASRRASASWTSSIMSCSWHISPVHTEEKANG